MKIAITLVLLVGIAIAQDKPVAAAPKPVTLSQAMQVKLLKAEHENDTLVANEQQIQIQAAQCTNERIQAMQTTFNSLESKKAAVQKAVADALDEAQKECGPKEDVTLDPANFTCVKVVKAAASAPTLPAPR